MSYVSAGTSVPAVPALFR